MVELLTVIGIIAVLIAILMPTLTKARQASQTIVCRSNLHQIYTAALMFSSEHHGFMQIAGKMNGAPDATPSEMGDPDQTKYMYFTDNGQPRPVPFPIACANYMGGKIRLDSAANLVADFTSPSCTARKIFTCPSQPEPPMGMTVSDDDGWYGPRLPISYAFNEGILGYEGGNESDRRFRGQFSKAQPSAEILFMTDAVPRSTDGGSDYIAWYPSPTGRATLADAFTEENSMSGMNTQFDSFRHQGKLNIIYFDGHVDSLIITEEDLQHGVILPQ